MGAVAMNELLQDSLHRRLIVVDGRLAHVPQYGRKLGPGHKIFTRLHDALMRSYFRVVANEQFLIELFPGTKTGDSNFYIAIRAVSYTHLTLPTNREV